MVSKLEYWFFSLVKLKVGRVCWGEWKNSTRDLGSWYGGDAQAVVKQTNSGRGRWRIEKIMLSVALPQNIIILNSQFWN